MSAVCLLAMVSSQNEHTAAGGSGTHSGLGSESAAGSPRREDDALPAHIMGAAGASAILNTRAAGGSGVHSSHGLSSDAGSPACGAAAAEGDEFATQRASPEADDSADEFATQRAPPPPVERYLVPASVELVNAGARPVELWLGQTTVVGAPQAATAAARRRDGGGGEEDADIEEN